MTVRAFRLTAIVLLLALVCVPAATQPGRRLSAGPVRDGSSFSRVCEVQQEPQVDQPALSAAALVTLSASLGEPDAIVGRRDVPRKTPPLHAPLAAPPAPLRAPPALL
jgi:hypothetical protein